MKKILGLLVTIIVLAFSSPNAQAAYVANDPVNKIDPTGERTDVYIGGAGDKDGPLPGRGSGIVQNYADNQKGQDGRTVAYFGENDGEMATAFINGQIAAGNDEPINIIGHSYGAATAVEVAKGVNGKVDTLVGVDPVGKPGIPNTTSKPSNVGNVIRVDNQGRGSLGGEIAETLGRAAGGVPDAFEEAPMVITNDFGHSDFQNAYESGSGPYQSAKEYVDDTYRD